MKNPNKKLLELVEKLEQSGVLQSEKIKKAFLEIDRKDFVLEEHKEFAYNDTALPLSKNQTISQPTTVVFMLELLNLYPDQKILDIGAGSGWTGTMLAKMVSPKGRVFAYEINKKVGKFGQKNIEKYNLKNITYKISDASEEWSKNSPYDRILSGAAFKTIPEDLKEKLAPNGILVAPTQDGFVKKIVRLSDGDLIEEKFFGFSFVPFIKKS
ncbi:MAG: methyltransferase [Patescibacteria group bacterium]|jgi:protein-L-isoaspartate(D-aspartate) O-methyltransferase|nr:methyltransferase [Patescibacteria group bacterium]